MVRSNSMIHKNMQEQNTWYFLYDAVELLVSPNALLPTPFCTPMFAATLSG